MCVHFKHLGPSQHQSDICDAFYLCIVPYNLTLCLGFVTSPQGIRGYISVMAALKLTYLLIKGILFFKNNWRTPLISDVFIQYDR